ncbi:VWA domain-containing protein [Dokdonella koreensis]|uniref:Membrane protein involved in colicin uptake n=1 Tax=Dokdonella koreensis DS-123 TaxID=1300342 RepID=A0A161HRB1_9GAMM|nr:VWA domain-containing protein [Dokdonella koreensis]ANB18122.1 Membrane protein involved in colicin uptake [Dokdonella koreensis DS-123]
MTSALADFHFLRPLWLLALLALPLLLASGRLRRADAGAWRHAVDPQLLPHLLESGDDRAGRGSRWVAAAAWTIGCLALAGPAWEREPMPLYRNESARVIVLELAPSMLAQDLKPSRLERARHKIGDILDRSRDQQTALIGYAGDAFVAAPLTDDVNTVRNLVQALDPTVMPVSGNATGRAIERAVDLIRQAGARSGEIIVIADSASADAAAAAAAAAAQGLHVSVLAVGTAAGAPVALPDGGFLKSPGGEILVPKLEEDRLQAVAAGGKGRYVAVSADGGDLDALLGSAPATRGNATELDDAARSARFRDRGPWLLLLMLPVALAGFRRGWLMALAVCVVLPAPHAGAASLADLWRRQDQQAAAALSAGDAKTALEVARSPDWRGSAAFRAGDYQAAVQAWQQAEGAEAAYNEGNALAKLGKYEEAIAAYDRALGQAPDMADAKANRQAIEEWLEQQQAQQPSSPPPEGQPGETGESQPEGQGQDPGQSGEPSQGGQGGQSAPAQDPAADGQQGQDEPASSGTPKDAGDGKASDAGKPDDPASTEAERAGQKQALSEAIDQALAQGKGGQAPAAGEPKKPGEAPALSAQEAADQEQQQAMKQWMERIPDDPGGLLRRKFLLEYQRRQQGGGNGP